MSERIRLDGPNAKFRISRPGKDISSTDPRDFLLREDSVTYWPLFTGSVAMGSGNSNQSVSLPAAVQGLPFIVLKCSDGAMPIPPDVNGNGIFALISSSGTAVKIYNTGSARTITYFIFGNPFG